MKAEKGKTKERKDSVSSIKKKIRKHEMKEDRLYSKLKRANRKFEKSIKQGARP